MGRKAEDSKVEAQKKMVVQTHTTNLFLQNNELRELTGLNAILREVMWDSSHLLWLDLSYNILTTIDEEITQFPLLKTLYLHKNYISNMDEVKKL